LKYEGKDYKILLDESIISASFNSNFDPVFLRKALQISNWKSEFWV